MFAVARAICQPYLAAGVALVCLSATALAQQPTLRYSREAARSVTPGQMSAQTTGEEESDDVIGTGIRPAVRRAAYDGPVRTRTGMPTSHLPRNQRASAFQSAGEISPEVIGTPSAGERIILDEGAGEMPIGPRGAMYAGEDCASCGHGGYGRMYCGDPSCGTCGPDCCLRVDNIELFAGAHGFTGPNNRGSNSFGFHEGINVGMPFICCLALQGGFQATQSNFEGSFFTPDDRTQSFVTVGLFRRVDLGLQLGVVVDYLHDEWDCKIDLAQLRGELSWRMPCENEFGFWFAAGLDRETIQARNVQFPVAGADESTIVISDGTFTVEPIDMYAFFYRKQFACGGQGRLFGGFTDDSRGLLGGSIRLPVSSCLSFTTDFLYILPREASQTGFAEEAWNVSFNFVWTPCRRNQGGPNYCRPLFDVANNGSFVVRMK